jgi:hypothetical protein
VFSATIVDVFICKDTQKRHIDYRNAFRAISLGENLSSF